MRITIFIGLLVLSIFQAKAQDSTQVITDTITEITGKNHSPTKAALLSAVLPGAGQFYNRKYWKLPIVYAAVGGLSFAVGFNANKYKIYRKAIELREDEDSTTVDDFDGVYTAENLRTLKDYYRRNLDLSAIFLFVVHVLNIVDATVDAHLFEYDISDDLTMQWQPTIFMKTEQNKPLGIALKFKF